MNPVVCGETWRLRVKGAVLSVLPGGHMVLHEAPEQAAGLIAEFLGA
jgi:pimeloyl-ACP methyl ester carboxylesterase